MKPARIDDTLSRSERQATADHVNHLDRDNKCLACHTKEKVTCPNCGRQVFPWCQVDKKEVITRRYGVDVRVIRRKCRQCL